MAVYVALSILHPILEVLYWFSQYIHTGYNYDSYFNGVGK